ncbi:MAG TPA: porin family protein [Vicinamibacterales bacterium]|nr:porin family protein [Vicinamibacterales bacterium]
MTTRISTCAAAWLMLVACSASANAQTTATNAIPKFEVGGGYQWVDVGSDLVDNTFPGGLGLDVAVYRWGQLALAGELGWSHDSSEAFGNSVSSTLFHIGAGPRFAIPLAVRALPYAQAFIGYARNSSSATFSGTTLEASANAFMFQFGGGATVKMGNNWGLFGDLSYRHAFYDNATDEFQLYLGARFFVN